MVLIPIGFRLFEGIMIQLQVSLPAMVIFIILTLSRMESGAKVCPILKGMPCRDNPSQCPGFYISNNFLFIWWPHNFLCSHYKSCCCSYFLHHPLPLMTNQCLMFFAAFIKNCCCFLNNFTNLPFYLYLTMCSAAMGNCLVPNLRSYIHFR